MSELDADPSVGLTGEEVKQRREHFGPNTLRTVGTRSLASLIGVQFKSIVVALLVAAVVVALLIGDHVEAIAIGVVIGINGMLGFLMEWRAVRSMEALHQLGRVHTTVRRSGHLTSVPADDLVPGDIIEAQGGDVITADARLVEAAQLEVDESTLTGESVPVSKTVTVLIPDTAVMDRVNSLHKGTTITSGTALAVVIATGVGTELGKIAELVSNADAQDTPLEQRLDALGRRLVWVVLVLGAVLAVGGVVTGRELSLSIEVAIALAVAAIPEGLPVVATIALARGMHRMARRNALVRRLSAVETLGATSIILTDKTGTLTENKMTLTRLRMPFGQVEMSVSVDANISDFQQDTAGHSAEAVTELLTIAALCNNAAFEPGTGTIPLSVGDPTEIALLVGAAKQGLTRSALLKEKPEAKEVPFSSASLAMATFHQCEDELLVAVKGSPEAIIDACISVRSSTGEEPMSDAAKADWRDQANQLGDDGLRTLAIACKRTDDIESNPYEGLTLLGIAGLQDPPRSGIKKIIARCRAAGMEIVMVTGDHIATARHIARAVGLLESGDGHNQVIDARVLPENWSTSDESALTRARVIARATPEQKLNLIALYQRQNNVVAMTGDGVNDAPALRQADIGVAMGMRGTQVAKDAADIVLQDDNLSTIVEAVAQGRTIYANIRRFVIYLMSCNLAEILIVSIATFAGAPLPLLPLQILFLNLVTDVFPALALGMGEGSPIEMTRPPRPADEPLLTRRHWTKTIVYGAVMALTVLASMSYARFILHCDNATAVSIAFCTLAFAQLWHVFNMRHSRASLLNNNITRSPWIAAALLLCVLLVLIAIYVPSIAGPLELTDPGTDGWILIGIASLMPVLLGTGINRMLSRSEPV